MGSEDSSELRVDLANACNAQDVKHTVREAATEVRVLVESLDPSTNESCGYTELVELTAPLGDRVVVDDSTGEAVRLSDHF